VGALTGGEARALPFSKECSSLGLLMTLPIQENASVNFILKRATNIPHTNRFS
jgi:hypothetical protein